MFDGGFAFSLWVGVCLPEPTCWGRALPAAAPEPGIERAQKAAPTAFPGAWINTRLFFKFQGWVQRQYKSAPASAGPCELARAGDPAL